MKQIFLYPFFLCVFFSNLYSAERVFWSGKVDANGKPTDSIKLELGKEYSLKVTGEVNLGKWWQQKKPLANDACYEFSDATEPPVRTKFTTFKNSLNIQVCDGKYHPDHIYQSAPFFAVQTGIHFWIYDTNYEDNSGALDVQIIQVSDEGE